VDRLTEILRKLSQHESTPDKVLFDKILERTHADAPASLDNQLKELKDFSEQPPMAQFEKLQKAVTGAPVHDIKKNRPSLAGFLAIAASLVLATAIWFFYNNDEKKSGTIAETDPVKTTPQLPSSPAPMKDSATPLVKNITETKTKIRSLPPASVNGEKALAYINIKDNDLLYSLTFVNYATFEPYFNGKKKKMVLDIDQYSSASVSPRMLNFMKDLYSTNRKQLPTRKAKRAKKTLNRWKKIDATYFDSTSGSKSAMDILDLTEFLIENKRK
jgi:hypothetical protein